MNALKRLWLTYLSATTAWMAEKMYDAYLYFKGVSECASRRANYLNLEKR